MSTQLTVPKQWIDSARDILLETENHLLNIRCKVWSIVINRVTNNTLKLFQSDIQTLNYQQFHPDLNRNDIAICVKYITDWKGLTITCDHSDNITLERYIYKAKNWLNGKRSKDLADTLYPMLIKKTEKYAKYITDLLIQSQFANNKKKRKSCFNAMIYLYLYKLCESRIDPSVTKHRSVWLIAENSMNKHKTQLREMFRKYASTHQYVDRFPSHRQQAIDHYKEQYQIYFKELKLNDVNHDIQSNNDHKKRNNSNKMDIDIAIHEQNNYAFNSLISVMNTILIEQTNQDFQISNVSSRLNCIQNNHNSTQTLLDIILLQQQHGLAFNHISE